MKKKFMTLIAAAVFAVALTACGAAQTGNNPSPTAEPTAEAEGTTAPTVGPTAASTPVPTDTPEPAATSTPAPESTKAPEPTSTSAPEPTATPAPTEAPVPETPDFGTVLKELHSLETYEEREAYIETLDKARYEVAAADNFDLITRANGVYIDVIETYDMETGDYIRTIAPDSRVYYPSFSEEILALCIGIYGYGETGEIPTGEVYLMTITDLATGETDPWGVKIHKAGVKIVEEEDGWGWTSYNYIVDPESAVTVVCCTVEELVNEKNDGNDTLYGYTHEEYITYVEPVTPWEEYDEDWNPTGGYYIYETSKETIFVEPEAVKWDEWGNYYCYDAEGGTWTVTQDENGAYYYILEEEYTVSVKDRGYTVVQDEEYGAYLVDENGDVVTGSYERTEDARDPDITTWDTLKYYYEVYDPQIWKTLMNILREGTEYDIADLEAEDYPYLDVNEFNSIIKRYMELHDIVLDEEILAIKASMPESWDSSYNEYYDKAGVFYLSYKNEVGNYVHVAVTIDRPDNWYFWNHTDGCELVVKDESIREGSPAHNITYRDSRQEAGTNDAETKENAVEGLLELKWDKAEEDIDSLVVNGMQIFFIETSGDTRRTFTVFQDIGLPNFVLIEIETYDVGTDTDKFLEQFLLNDNYTLEQ